MGVILRVITRLITSVLFSPGACGSVPGYKTLFELMYVQAHSPGSSVCEGFKLPRMEPL